jgi:hypothetical protein
MWSPNHRSITKPTCRRKRKLDMVYKVKKYERMKHSHAEDYALSHSSGRG